MLAVAAIPLAKIHFTGCICAIVYHGQEYRLATYRGVKVESWSERGVLIRQGKFRLEVELYRYFHLRGYCRRLHSCGWLQHRCQAEGPGKTLFLYLLTVEAIVGLVALLIVEIFPQQLIGIFGASNESQYYTDFAIKSFRTYLCLIPLATVNKGTFIYLQSIGKALSSAIISLVREIVLGVGFALLLPVFFGLDGVLYSFPAADVLTFVVAVFVIISTYRELRVGNSIKKQ